MNGNYKCFTTTQQGNVTVVCPDETKFQTQHESATHSLFLMRLRDELVDLIEKLPEQPPKLVINMQHLDRGSSELVGACLKVRERVLQQRGKLALCGMNEWLRNIYSITFPKGRIFDIHESEEQAVAALSETAKPIAAQKSAKPATGEQPAKE